MRTNHKAENGPPGTKALSKGNLAGPNGTDWKDREKIRAGNSLANRRKRRDAKL